MIAVAGNVGLELTTRNSLRVLDWLGATSVPVYAGADAPLSGDIREASHWHAADGLGGARLPASTRAASPDGIGNLCERLLAEPGALTLVCTGPLTNLALALQREPRIVSSVREIVLMGGAARVPGNVTPVAEFNIYADPVAAACVFEQSLADHDGRPGRDRTRALHARRRSQALAATIRPRPCWCAKSAATCSTFATRSRMALHDPLALAVAVQPDLVATLERDVDVEARGEHTLGQTVVDWRRSAAPATRHTRVCTEVDVERARAFFFTTLGF